MKPTKRPFSTKPFALECSLVPIPLPRVDYKLCTMCRQNCSFLRNVFLIKRKWKQIKIICSLTAHHKQNIVSLLWYSYTDTHHEKTSQKPTLSNTLQNNWPVIFKCVQIIKVKGSFWTRSFCYENIYGATIKTQMGSED